MRIESIDIDGFRGIPELKLEFPGQINVLVGVNGAGKSAVLDCTAIMLSRLIGRIRSTTGTGRFFSESDINNHDRETRNKISIQFRGQTVSWRVTKRPQRVSATVPLRARGPATARGNDSIGVGRRRIFGSPTCRLLSGQSRRSRHPTSHQGEILFEKVPTKSMRYGEMHIFFRGWMIRTKNLKIINGLNGNQLGI